MEGIPCFPFYIVIMEKNMNESKAKTTAARLASLDELIENILPNFISPVPQPDTIRSWFDAAKIPRFKANPTAKRGGGRVFYSVSAVEKFLGQRTLICRLTPTGIAKIVNHNSQ